MSKANMTHQAIEKTERWLEHWVIKENLCPFAHKEWAKKTIRYEVLKTTDDGEVFDHFLHELQYLKDNPSIATTLIIWPNCNDFDDFLGRVAMLEMALQTHRLDATFQLAHFHPNYTFEGAQSSDAENYTNRSPYPMLHILRSEDMEKVLSRYPNPESIPENNIARMNEIGEERLKAILSKLTSD
ncbi:MULTISPECIES: DUF1415 domain-containing protein [Gammaproteobacteria]|uniref:DUF1415 domain-containing protein n=1 Tax=Gammaproteobacteria TaxID=1236 RepID=UPI000DD051B3|nr:MULTISPECIES: DUF1415 domain-containing protein [Gammaproteobacteria]RTE86882.1 DUF1415 domain-containing protein [Aliidiomarina sp. B3213]TCZ93328.1 DUF1415 domain-containing protein [Lysobacter sp. N42]